MPLTFSKLPGYAIEGESITLDQTSNDIDAAIGSGGGPKIEALAYPNANTDTRADAFETLTLSGSGFGTNANVWVGTSLSSNTVVINSNSITFVCPLVSVGNNAVYVVNTDGGTGSFSPGVQVTAAAGFQGVNYGYTSGGQYQTPPDNTIDKFPFASDSNATDVGNLSQARFSLTGQSSPTNGYSSAGYENISNPARYVSTIDKFPFASDGNATDAGDLTSFYGNGVGQSSITNGYVSGGFVSVGGQAPLGTQTNNIERFPFAVDSGSVINTSDLTQTRYNPAGQSSSTNGYTSGGVAVSTVVNTTDKFSFATDANATDVGDLSQARSGASGQSSAENGYTSGGSPGSNVIDKFPFASDANATDVGDLTQSRSNHAGQSSTVSGYSSGGFAPPYSNIIDKFPFATNANATDVGDLTVGRSGSAGQQN
jgi:hypothetical protein